MLKSRVTSRAMKSVVLVADKGDIAQYCIGFVIMKSHTDAEEISRRSTLVVVSSQFVSGREHNLEICFSDSWCCQASVVSIQGQFCLVRTEEHKNCEAIRWMTDQNISSLTPTTVFVVLPSSPTTMCCRQCYMLTESLESYSLSDGQLVADSGDYVVVGCSYRDKTVTGLQKSHDPNFILERDGLDRLTAAPVFDMSGAALGIIVRYCRMLRRAGHLLRVTIKAPSVKKQLELLIKRKGAGQKRKRGPEQV